MTVISNKWEILGYSLEENIPVLTKALRLTYEHIEANGAFLVPIPDDEPLDGEEMVSDVAPGTENNLESLEYLISLFSDLSHKNNMSDLREYNKALLEF